MAILNVKSVEMIKAQITARYQGIALQNPEASIFDILHTMSGLSSDVSVTDVLVWMVDNFENTDLDEDRFPIDDKIECVLNLKVGNLAGSVSANTNEAESMKNHMLLILSDGNPVSRKDLLASAFPAYRPGNPQTDADMSEAFKRLIDDPSIVRLNKDGNPSKQGKWATVHRIR